MGCHLTAFYDAAQICLRCISSLGMGFSDISLELDLKGFDWGPLLPKAMGESCTSKASLQEKLQRANQRKREALAAIERERVRRETSEEEKERMRREKIEAIQREREAEEKALFDTAYLSLNDYRGSSRHVTRAEMSIMLQKWIDLSKLIEDRYPYSLKSAICHNNCAVILLETDSENEAQAQQDAYTLAVQSIDEVMHILYSEFPIQRIVEETNFEIGFAEIPFEKQMIPIYVLLLQNGVSVLRQLNDYSILSEKNEIIVTLAFLVDLMSSKMKENLNAERKLHDMIILPMGDVVGSVAESLREFNQFKATEIKRKELELLMQKEAELNAASKLRTESPEEMLGRLRREKELARNERRRERRNMISARKKLYAMIQSDQVSSLFRLRARNVAKSFGEGDPDISDPFDSEH